MPTIKEVFTFSHSSDFPVYQKWLSLSQREKTDPSIQLSTEEVKHLESWDFIRNIYEIVLPDAVSVLKKYESDFKFEFAKYEKAVKDLEDQNKLFEFYKSVLDRLTKLYLESLSQMLTEIYREIYQTTSKQIMLVMEDFRGKKVVRLNVVNKINGKDYIESFENEGGSVHVMLGAIVAIYFILTVGLPRIIIFDESLSALFTTTLHKFLGVLRQFVDQLGFTFVIIAHDAIRMEGFIDKVYMVDDGVYRHVDKDGFFSHLKVIYE